MEVIKYMDEEFTAFVELLIKEYMNNNSAIFIVSDHGNNMVGLHGLKMSQDYELEKTLGVFFLILPNNKQYDEYGILVNEQRLINIRMAVYKTL